MKKINGMASLTSSSRCVYVCVSLSVRVCVYVVDLELPGSIVRPPAACPPARTRTHAPAAALWQLRRPCRFSLFLYFSLRRLIRISWFSFRLSVCLYVCLHACAALWQLTRLSGFLSDPTQVRAPHSPPLPLTPTLPNPLPPPPDPMSNVLDHSRGGCTHLHAHTRACRL